MKAGEEVLVTSRGQAVARLVPVGTPEGVDPHLLELERKGLAKIGRGKLPPDFWDMPRPEVNWQAVLKALLNEREENR